MIENRIRFKDLGLERSAVLSENRLPRHHHKNR